MYAHNHYPLSIRYAKVKEAVSRLHNWRQKNGWRGFDPFGIREKLYEKYGADDRALELQAMISSLEKDYHFDKPQLFHKLLGDKGYEDPKTFANFGTGYLNLYSLSGEQEYIQIAKECGDWLITESEKRNLAAWGHPFVWHTEANQYFHEKHNPNIYITSLVTHFLLDLYESTQEERFLLKASKAVDFLASLPHLTDQDDRICFWYAIDQKELPVHNASLFVASALIRSESKTYLELGERAIDFTLADQNDDGSWYYYGPPRASNMMMIDNYHTGYILEALHHSNKMLARDDVEQAIDKGLSFYRQMFSPLGEPYRLGGEPFPQDIHDAAQGIITFSLLKHRDPENLDISQRIAKWAIENMQDEDGHFYYRKLIPDTVIKIPYMRWAQAPMFKALCRLIRILSESRQD